MDYDEWAEDQEHSFHWWTYNDVISVSNDDFCGKENASKDEIATAYEAVDVCDESVAANANDQFCDEQEASSGSALLNAVLLDMGNINLNNKVGSITMPTTHHSQFDVLHSSSCTANQKALSDPEDDEDAVIWHANHMSPQKFDNNEALTNNSTRISFLIQANKEEESTANQNPSCYPADGKDAMIQSGNLEALATNSTRTSFIEANKHQ